MKKIIILGLTGTILAGGYAGVWHYNAGNLKNEFNGEFDKLSKQAKDNGANVSIASVSTSGFPGNIKLNLNQLSMESKDLSAKMAGISIERGISSNKLSLTDWSDLDIKAGEFDLTAKTGKGNYFCIQFSDNQFFNFLTGKLSFNPFKGDSAASDALKTFKSFEWNNTSDHELVDKKSGEALVKHGPSNLSLTVDVADKAASKIAFKALLKDLEFTKAFDTFLQKMSPDQNIKASNLSIAGKSNLDIDMTYTGLTDLELLGKQDVNFKLDIDKYDSSSALGEGKTNGSMNIKIGADKNPVEGAIKLNATYKFTPEFGKYFKETMELALENILAMEKSSLGNEVSNIEDMKIIFGNMDVLFPNMDQLGEIKYAMDMDFNVADRKLNLKDFSFSTENYAVSLKGNGNLTDLTKPEVKGELFIKNYEEFATIIFDYVKRVEKLMKDNNKLSADIVIDPAIKQKIVEFLKNLAGKQAAESKDLKLELSISGDKIKIGEMDGPAAMMMLMMLFAPQS